MSAQFPRGGGGVNHDFTQFAVIILCDDSTGCVEMDNYFATEADTSIIDNVCRVDLNKIRIEHSHLTCTFIKLLSLNVTPLCSFFISIYYSIIRIRKNVKKPQNIYV